jgi:hypothetical protein
MNWETRSIIEAIQWILAVTISLVVLYELVAGKLKAWDFGTTYRVSRREEPRRYWGLMAIRIPAAALLVYFAID